MPSPIETMETRLAELRAEVKSLTTQRGALIDQTITEKRAFTADEQTRHDSFTASVDAVKAQIPVVEARIAELSADDQARAAHDAVRIVERSDAKVTDAPIYAEGKVDTSYFRDTYYAGKGDRGALDRLTRNTAMTADQVRALSNPSKEQIRALGNTGAAGGSGGEFAPPLWVIDEFIALARPGRKFADSLNPKPLPTGVSSVNLPRVSGGSSTAVQTTQNAGVANTDMTTNSVNSGITTIAGKQIVALQLLEQTGIPFDEVVLQDLAADYARQFSAQSISGSAAAGQLNGVYTYFAASGTTNVTWTNATPTVGGTNSLYSNIFKAASAVETTRFLPPDTIWMHPRRWNWILSGSDTTNRPLVNPSATSMNVVAQSSGVGAAQGIAGMIGSLEVITDPNIPTNISGTQDPILVGVRSDLRLWESSLRSEAFEQPYAESVGVLFRVLAFSAAIPQRYTTSVSVITGTGCTTPTF